MPQLFVHITVTRQIAGDDRLHPLALEALRRREPLLRLGTVLPDLAYFDGIRWRALRHKLGLSQPEAPWSERMHSERAMQLGIALLGPQRRALLGPLSRLALAAGFFCHAALDTALHPLVHRLMDAEGVLAPRARRAAYMRIEKVQSVLFHRHLYGDGGDPDAPYLAAADLHDEARAPRVLLHIESAVRLIYGRAPNSDDLIRWMDGLAWYRRALQGSLQRAEGSAPDLESLGSRYFDEPGYLERVEEAGERAIAWVNRIARVFEPGDTLSDGLDALRALFPEAGLDQAEDPFAQERYEGDFYQPDEQTGSPDSAGAAAAVSGSGSSTGADPDPA